MGTSIEHEKFLWRGYRLLEQWPGSCFLSLEPLISSLSIKSLLQADTEGRIKQVIVGGESEKGARPMHPTCVRQLRDETLEAGRAFFFKQWGDGNWTKQWLKEIGRTLDGREWNESPWPVPLPINERREESARKVYDLWERRQPLQAKLALPQKAKLPQKGVVS